MICCIALSMPAGCTLQSEGSKFLNFFFRPFSLSFSLSMVCSFLCCSLYLFVLYFDFATIAKAIKLQITIARLYRAHTHTETTKNEHKRKREEESEKGRIEERGIERQAHQSEYNKLLCYCRKKRIKLNERDNTTVRVRRRRRRRKYRNITTDWDQWKLSMRGKFRVIVIERPPTMLRLFFIASVLILYHIK